MTHKVVDPDLRDHCGCTALMFAFAFGHPETTQLVITEGINLNLRDRTESLDACKNKQPGVPELLVQNVPYWTYEPKK